MTTVNEQCPDTNALAEFLEGKLFDKQHAYIAEHLSRCETCRDLCRYAAQMNAKEKNEVKMTAKDKDAIRRQIREAQREIWKKDTQVVWRAFVSKVNAVFTQLELAEVVAASEVNSVICFSADTEDENHQWKLQLIIPNQRTDALKLKMDTPKDANGMLIFCGNHLNVIQGETCIDYEVFTKTYCNPEVAFVFEDGKKIAGYPLLMG